MPFDLPWLCKDSVRAALAERSSYGPGLVPPRGSKPVPALDKKRHGVKISPVGVAVLEVDEEAFVVDEVRPGVPSRDVQLDKAVARHPEGGDVLNPRPHVITEVAGLRTSPPSGCRATAL